MRPPKTTLSEQQQRFVNALVAGAPNHTEAARLAGYTGAPHVLHVTAHNLLKLPKVQRAILEMVSAEGTAASPAAMRNLIAVATDKTHKQTTRAAIALLGMQGIAPLQRTEKRVEHRVEAGSAVERLRQLISQLQQLPMSNVAKLIDVTPTTEKKSEDWG
jgi:phage terminase small subunit